MWGYSETEGKYYKKTHRGKRGRPTNTRLREALEEKELALERERDLQSDLKSLKAELRNSKEALPSINNLTTREAKRTKLNDLLRKKQRVELNSNYS